MRARLGLAIGAVVVMVLSASALGAKPRAKHKHKLPHIVYIRYQLSESFQRVSQSTGTVKLTATADVVQEATPGDLKRDTIIHGLRLISSSFNAETPGPGGGACLYTGKLPLGGAADIGLTHGGRGKTYGLVVWPAQHEGSYTQKTTSPGCQPAALFTPLQGAKVFSSPGVGNFSAMDRFDNAIFPVSVPRGQKKIKVSMSSDQNFAGETNQTRATGLITISYGRCPSGLKRCKPTNGSP